MAGVHFVSVGTSLISNYNRSEGRGRGEVEVDIRGWERMRPLDFPQGFYEKFRRELPLYGRLLKSLLKFIENDPKASCAELNSLLSFTTPDKVSRVYLMHTPTPPSLLAAHVIGDYLEARSIPVELVELPGYTGEGDFNEGLASTLSKLVELLEKEEERGERFFYINPTGGYKPESSIMVIAGYLIPKITGIYYIHESFKKIVILSPIPLALDKEWYRELENIEDTDPGTAREIVKNSKKLYPWEELLEKRYIKIEKNKVKINNWIKKLYKLSLT